MMSDAMLQAALKLASQAWPVFPLAPGAKLPNKGTQGFKDATSDPDQVRRLWAMFPGSNVGIACGDGFIVIDLDRHASNTDGLTTWTALCEQYQIDGETLAVTTPSGGRHLYYQVPDNEIGNSAGKLGTGIDVRGLGGYVVAPPSCVDGKVYIWHDGPILPLPEPIQAMLAKPEEPARRQQATPTQERDLSAYVRTALDNEIAAVANATEGTRNDTLNRAAYSLGQLVGAAWAGLDQTTAENALLGAAQDCGLPESEALRTIASGLDSGSANPRAEPPDARPPAAGAKIAYLNGASGTLPPTEQAPGEQGDLIDAYHYTDLGNSKRLVALHGRDLRFCYPWGRWLCWDGLRWAVDETGEIERKAKSVPRSVYLDAGRCADEDRRKALAKWALQSEARHRIAAMIDLARSELGMAVLPDNLDADPWLLNVQNGTLDLRTGELRAHDQGDLLTKLAPTVYDPGATCPIFISFLDRVMAGSLELIRFLQRAIGYSLTGNTSERALFILHGTGANGKSTLLEAIRGVLGDYALRTPTTTLLSKPADGVPNDVARLKGARFVSASESEDGRRLAEALIKDLTGGDTISARYMRAEWFDFKPECKIWLGTNHKPAIRGTDNAIWTRIRLIPFAVTIPEAEQDKQLAEKLQAEAPGILAWAVRGCQEWQKSGLGTPPAVQAATGEYRNEMDGVGQFLSECCIDQPMATVTIAALYESYKEWAEGAGEYILSKRKLGQRLKERGFVDERTNRTRFWLGLGLLE